LVIVHDYITVHFISLDVLSSIPLGNKRPREELQGSQSCETVNMVIRLAGLGTKNDCADEDQQ
jgi:hypothetical protein